MAERAERLIYPAQRFVMAVLLAIFASIAAVIDNAHADVAFIDPRPLTEVVTTTVQDCSGDLSRFPVIAWGADLATSYANGNATKTQPGSIFAEGGLNVVIYRQDDFVRQLEDFLACKTPFLRATNGMLQRASGLLAQDSRTAPVVVYQLSNSTGGDALVVTKDIKKPENLRGKRIVLQGPGPQEDFMMRILKDAGLTVDDVTILYVKDLIQVDEHSSSPAMAFAEGKADAAFVISPDALALTSGGTVGTGSEGSVKGAYVLLSTKSLPTVITDLYVVRKDFFDAHQDQVQAFVHGLLRAEEAVTALVKSQGEGYDDMLSAGASLILDNPADTAVMAEMYTLDLTMAGYRGNVEFFGNPKNPRRFEVLVNEAQDAFMQLGFLSKRVPVAHAMWDYAALAKGLSNTANVEVPKFDAAAVARVAEARAHSRSDEGSLFPLTVYFPPNESELTVDSIAPADLEWAFEKVTTYGGAIMSFEAHADTLGYLECKLLWQEPSYRPRLEEKVAKRNTTIKKQCLSDNPGPMQLQQLRTAARNKTLARGNAVMDVLVAYALSEHGVTLDRSQFGVVGLGITQPNIPGCTYDAQDDPEPRTCAPKTEDQWNKLRRVDFKILQVESEPVEFSPL